MEAQPSLGDIQHNSAIIRLKIDVGERGDFRPGILAAFRIHHRGLRQIRDSRLPPVSGVRLGKTAMRQTIKIMKASKST